MVEIELKNKPETKGNQKEILRINLKYNLGGVSWATGRETQRCYRLHITPITREFGDYYTSDNYMGFSGRSIESDPIKRQSKKAEDKAREYFKNEKTFVEAVIKTVLRDNHLETVEPLDIDKILEGV